jgi:hypothetical protein
MVAKSSGSSLKLGRRSLVAPFLIMSALALHFAICNWGVRPRSAGTPLISIAIAIADAKSKAQYDAYVERFDTLSERFNTLRPKVDEAMNKYADGSSKGSSDRSSESDRKSILDGLMAEQTDLTERMSFNTERIKYYFPLAHGYFGVWPRQKDNRDSALIVGILLPGIVLIASAVVGALPARST